MSLVRQIASYEKRKYSPQEYSHREDPTWIKCDSSRLNATDISEVPQQSGIWPNLGANIIIFSVALAVFFLLKKKMFNQAPETHPTTAPVSPAPNKNARRLNIGTAIFGERAANGQSAGDAADTEKRTRIWYWRLKDALSETDYELLTRGGLGALEYVRFQRYVLLFSVMVCIMSLCIVLPSNLAGDLFSDSMGQLSATNLSPQSSRLWFHVLLTLVLFPLAIAAMRQFGLRIEQNSFSSDQNSRTVMFSGLPSERADVDLLKEHFRQAYPYFEVSNIDLTYDVGRLSGLEDELQTTEEAAQYCASLPAGSGKIQVKLGGCCCWSSSKVDADNYYAQKKFDLNQQLESEFRQWKKINPVFFVTFANNSQANQVHGDHQRCGWCRGRKRPQSSRSDELQVNSWTAFTAPDPSNINWTNLSQSGWIWYLKATVINLLILGIIALLTTIIVALNFPSLPKLQKFRNTPGVSQISPALIMLALQKLVPALIKRGVAWTGYWSRPKQLIAEMRYIFSDLLLAILVIPSLGLIGAAAVFFFGNNPTTQTKRECITLPDNGSLYINYLIFYAFTSTAMSLFRLNVLFSYFVRTCRAKSAAEEAFAARVDRPFSFAEEYASFLTAFTVTVVYSFINPMISLLGVVALMMKYLLDQYMLCNVYKRSNVPGSVHSVAVNQFLTSVLLQLIVMLLFFMLRGGFDSYTMILGFTLLVYGSILISIVFCGVCEKVSLYQLLNQGDGEPMDGTLELGNSTYVPAVLQRQQRRMNQSA